MSLGLNELKVNFRHLYIWILRNNDNLDMYAYKETCQPDIIKFLVIFLKLMKFRYWVGGFIFSNMAHIAHCSWVTHICVSKLTIIGLDNGLSPEWRQASIWNNAGILLIWTLGTNFSDFLIKIYTFSFKKIHLKMSSAKWWPFCLGLNVLS